MPVATREDRIRRFRVADRSADALTLRRQVERTFAGRALRPVGLSPTAIVCVRALRTPQPIGSAAWATRLDRELQRIVAGAVRPFRETVPAGATAVVFDDEAELLACLARDWRRGDGGAWWWCTLIGHEISEDGVVEEFVKSMAAVPAAIDGLAVTGLVREVIGGLSTASCARLLNDLAAGFAVPDSDGVVAVARDPVHRVEDLPALTPRLHRRARAAVLLSPGEDLRDMALPQRRLIATALMLNRDATLARTPGVVAAISRGWWPESEGPLATFAPARPSPDSGERPSPAQASPPAAAIAPGRRVKPAHDSGIRLSPATPVANATGNNDDRRDRSRQRMPAWLGASAGGLQVSVPPNRRPVPTHDDATPSTPSTMTFVASEFSGVLYLINVALHLELYGDFTQPARPGLALPVGDFLALVGERVCGPTLRRDALWDLLATLANRDPDDPPGADATPPVEMTLEAWVDRLTRQLAERTATAIGVEPELALSFLCIRAGRVALSATRLDVEFALADHALVLRLAGLDRNPGWVPAAGRIVEFHFR